MEELEGEKYGREKVGAGSKRGIVVREKPGKFWHLQRGESIWELT
jgi:hypothetical protein